MAEASTPDTPDAGKDSDGEGHTRRDFLYVATGLMAGIGVVAATWPLIDQMNASRDVLALATTDVDLSSIAEGQSVSVQWRGKPVFVRHRTADEIAAARSVPMSKLDHPEPDSERVIRDPWIVVIGLCTRDGCVLVAGAGDYGGWTCSCHHADYDTSGRSREMRAPANLFVPPYKFLDDTTIRIG